MTVYAFTDGDGYYQVDVPDGHSFPEWTKKLTRTDVLPSTPASAPVPVLTPRQIRLVLNAAGLRSQVEAAVGASSQDVKDMWEFSLEYRRDDAILNAMATAIGISNAQLDALFVQGATL